VKLQVFVFKDFPRSVLVHVPEGLVDVLRLPPLPLPFSKESVGEALAGDRIQASITESMPGPMSEALKKLKKDEKAARSVSQRQQDALKNQIMLGSIDPSERDRAVLVSRKNAIDAELRGVKDIIAQAKHKFALTKERMPADEYAALEKRRAELSSASQAIQEQITLLNREARDEHVRRHDARNDLFVREARKHLGEERFQEIWALVDAEMEERGEAA